MRKRTRATSARLRRAARNRRFAAHASHGLKWPGPDPAIFFDSSAGFHVSSSCRDPARSSPPPCGEGQGGGVSAGLEPSWRPPPPPAPPHKGELEVRAPRRKETFSGGANHHVPLPADGQDQRSAAQVGRCRNCVLVRHHVSVDPGSAAADQPARIAARGG
jgi:hypothetical protein